MKLFIDPPTSDWQALLQRPAIDSAALQATVAAILQDVQANGDTALRRYALQFDGLTLHNLQVTEAEMQAAMKQVPDALKTAIQTAAANIRTFHQQQQQPVAYVETMPGVTCWRRSVGIEQVGLYIPGGTAPLFSTVLMLAIPAGIAGCKDIILCTPPQKDGSVHPAVLYAASISGVTAVYKAGGAQAIAAMAYGTETIPKAAKLFGPGNQYVTCAKQMVQQQGTAIDMPAGPSEVCVLADETCRPAFVAADLLSQAEHGPDSQVVLVSNQRTTIKAVQAEISKQLQQLPRAGIAMQALENSRAFVISDLETAIALVNAYAPEHLIISHREETAIAEKIRNAGSVFIGAYTPESAGDYASGTNHTLPTNGFARAYSGVSLDSFVKKITYQQITRAGLSAIGNTIITMAEAEGLQAHAHAVKVRLQE
jgi:histidinol dehydrogenase